MVEDEILIAMDMMDLLEDLGAVVTHVDSLDKGLSSASTGTWDLAILDVSLGEGKTCRPLVTEMHNLGVPFILHSGDVQEAEGVLMSIKAPIVEKPSSSKQILAAINTAMSGRCDHT